MAEATATKQDVLLQKEEEKKTINWQDIGNTIALTVATANFFHPKSRLEHHRERVFNSWKQELLEYINKDEDIKKQLKADANKTAALENAVQRVILAGRDQLFADLEAAPQLKAFIQQTFAETGLAGLNLEQKLFEFQQQQAERYQQANENISPSMRKYLAQVKAEEDSSYILSQQQTNSNIEKQRTEIQNLQQQTKKAKLREQRRQLQREIKTKQKELRRLQDFNSLQRNLLQKIIYAELAKASDPSENLMFSVRKKYEQERGQILKKLRLDAKNLPNSFKIVEEEGLKSITAYYQNFYNLRRRGGDPQQTRGREEEQAKPNLSQIKSTQQQIKQLQEMPQKLEQISTQLQEFAQQSQQILQSVGKFMSENLPRFGEGVFNLFSKIGSFFGGGGGAAAAGGTIAAGGAATGAGVAAAGAAGITGAFTTGGTAVAAAATSEVWAPILIIVLVIVVLIILFILVAVLILNSGTVVKPAQFGNTNYRVSYSNSSNINNSSSALSLLPNPLPEVTNSARGYENSVRTNCLPNQAVYQAVSAASGLPWEVLAGVHYIEGGCRADASLVSGRTIGSIEPDVGTNCTQTQTDPGDPIAIVDENGQSGCGFSSLENSAHYAARHLKGAIGGRVPANYQELASALERYNGLGNRNCRSDLLNQLDSPPPYCPPAFPGDDHIYPMNYFDANHETMYLVYCADHTPCSPPRVYRRPGVLAIIRLLVEQPQQ